MKQHTRILLAAFLLLLYGVCLGIAGHGYVDVSSVAHVEAGSNGYHKVSTGAIDSHTTGAETLVSDASPVFYPSTKVEQTAIRALSAAFDSVLFYLFDGQRHVQLACLLKHHKARLLFPAHYFW